MGYHSWPAPFAQRFHLVIHFRVMSRCSALPTVGHMTVPSGPGRGTVMLPGDWTAELRRERMAELHRQADHQRLVLLVRAQRRDGTSGVGRGRRWPAGWLQGSGEGLMKSSTPPRALQLRSEADLLLTVAPRTREPITARGGFHPRRPPWVTTTTPPARTVLAEAARRTKGAHTSKDSRQLGPSRSWWRRWSRVWRQGDNPHYAEALRARPGSGVSRKRCSASADVLTPPGKDGQ
jgi:hypothetical protein